MMYECLIVPTESPNSLLEIKRALLTYDKIKLVDPNDRDLIPANTFISACSPSPFGIGGFNMGPVRPMGKVLGYDDIFEKIVTTCKPAIHNGIIEIISTYDTTFDKTTRGTLCSPARRDYPLNPNFVLNIYRDMAKNQQFLKQAIVNNKRDLLDNADISGGLALSGVGDGSINDQRPELPLINDSFLEVEQQLVLTQIARARIASMIKYAGFCEKKNLIPVFRASVYGGIVSQLLNNLHSVLNDINEDRHLMNRNRILELCHDEFLDDSILNAMSIEEVIKLRTKAWGVQAKSREILFAAVDAISLESNEHDQFEQKSKELIKNYRIEAESLTRERQSLNCKIKCDIATATLGVGAVSIGSLSQIASPFTIPATLAVGGAMWLLERRKEYVPLLAELKSNELKQKKGAGFGLHNFYSHIK